MRIILLFILLFTFFSCDQKELNSSKKENSESSNPTIIKLMGKWQEENDSLHILEFTDSEMIENYNGSEINRYEITFFKGLPGKGGYEDPEGKVIQIEESKDNFHHFSIEALDKNYLELNHRSSNESKFYKRLKN